MFEDDYYYRDDRPLTGGSEGVKSNLKLVEVLGCRMFIEEDALTVEGDPTGGTFKLRYQGYTTPALVWNDNAANIESVLNTLFSTNNLNITVECSGGPLPDDPVTITGDDFSSSELIVLFGRITGGDLLSNDIWAGSEIVYCAPLDKNGQKTYNIVEAKPTGPHYARGVQTLALRIDRTWLLQDCGGTWYAHPYDLANYATEGLKIEFDQGGPGAIHRPVNDSEEDPEEWTSARTLSAHPYLGTWHVYPLRCE